MIYIHFAALALIFAVMVWSAQRLFLYGSRYFALMLFVAAIGYLAYVADVEGLYYWMMQPEIASVPAR